MKPKSKLLSLLLTICLVAGLMPTAAFAAGTDTGKAIQLVDSGTAANIGGGQADNIYFGTYQQSSDGSGGYNTDPIKWRVLENANGQLFLLSDQNLDVFQYHTDYESVTWEKSTMRSWLNGYDASRNTGGSSGIDYTSDNFIGTAFSAKEQGAIADTTVVNDDNPDYGTEGGNDTTDKIFLLSIAEAQNSSYFADNSSRIATNTAYVAGGGKIGSSYMNGVGEAGRWWLRSPGYNANDAASVHDYGGVDSIGFYVNLVNRAVRPAFNLDLTSVLFTSAAAGGKSASGMDSGLTAVDDYTGSEWKLTLLDETREFAVTEQTVSGAPGGTITLNYAGATTGTNEYISVIIADSSGAQYYGRVAQPGGESGTATLSIPADLAPGSYTLNVFSEQYNGDYKTDYASAFAEVALTVEEAAAPGIDTGKAIQLVDSGTAANIGGGQADNIYFGTYQQSSAGSTEPDGTEGVDWIKSDTANKNGQDPYYYIDPVKWRVLSNASGQLFLLSDQNLDVFQYHTDSESVTWEKSTMRSWLNGYSAEQNTGGSSGIDYTSDNFIGTAFSEKEQKAIADTTVVNDDNPTYGTEGGENTNDKIFLLSIAEANNGSYFADDNSRIATNTAYVAGGGKIGGGMLGVGKADNWWLRSPGVDDDIAAYVDDNGGVRSFGPNVDFVITAVRPAFNLDLNSVLFTSAAAGGKSANGMDSGLTAIGNYAGNEWKLTLLDDSRDFSISNAAIEGSTVTFSYSNAKTGENEYISAVIENNGEITHYGRILQLDGTTNGANGTASLTIPAGVTLDNDTKLYVFNEQYNGDKMTDYASKFVDITLTVTDATPPTLAAGDATRTGAATATVTFTSSEAGTYYYAVVESGNAAPDNLTSTGTSGTCVTGTNTISVTRLSGLGAKDIYIVAEDAAGNVSSPALKITIPAYVAPTYTISADTAILDFGSAEVGYTAAPAAQEVTITNIGNQSVTVNLPTSTKYTITTGEGFENGTATLASGCTATFTVQPNTGLAIGSHSEILNISGSDGASASVKLSFTVNAVYTLTVNLNGGSGNNTGGQYPAGKVVNIDAGSRSNYRFNGWTSSNGDTFADASSASTTFTMPAADTTITANWTYSGGGGVVVNYYRLTFDVNGGSEIAPISRAANTTVDLSGYTPTREGYEFTGWYADEDLTDKITSIRLTHNTTIYAGWKEIKDNPSTGFENPFTDVSESDWFYEDVMFVFANDLMIGTSDTTFSPDITTSRAMIAVILWRLEGSPTVDAYTDFSDVADGAWYTEGVRWASSVGVVGGYPNGSFGPNDPITREQMAAMLYRYADYKGWDVTELADLSAFTDAESISGYAVTALCWANAAGIVGGYNDSTLRPQGNARRSEAAAMLQRFCEAYIDSEE